MIREIREQHRILGRIAPGHELLKYGSYHEGRFCVGRDIENKIDLLRKFVGEDEKVESIDATDMKKYEREVDLILHENYLDALKGAVTKLSDPRNCASALEQ